MISRSLLKLDGAEILPDYRSTGDIICSIMKSQSIRTRISRTPLILLTISPLNQICKSLRSCHALNLAPSSAFLVDEKEINTVHMTDSRKVSYPQLVIV